MSGPRIGVFIDLLGAHGRGIFIGIAGYARTAGWTLVHRNPWSASDFDTANYSPASLSEMGDLDGLIASCHTPEAAKVIRAVGVPTVNISSMFAGEDIPSVCTDARAVGTLAAEHLLQAGLVHFALLEAGQAGFPTARHEGFLATARAAGFEPQVLIVPRGSGAAQRRRLIVDWLKGLPLPIGLAVLHDSTALEILRLCQELGLAIPEQVALLGCDDDPLVQRMADPPLSSIRLNVERNGELAARVLADLLQGRRGERKPLLVPPLGVARRVSTDILAIGEPDVRTALQFIREHAGRLVTVQDVLEAVPLSRRPLEKRFRRVLGRSILQEIHRTKVERAKSLMVETNLAVGQVASACGIDSPARFSIVFRRVTGQSPTEYLRQVRTGS